METNLLHLLEHNQWSVSNIAARSVSVSTLWCSAVNVNVKYYSPTAPLSTLLKVPNTFEKFKSYKKLSNKPRLVCVHFLVLPFLTLSYGGNETDWLLSLLLLTRILILSFFVDSFWRWQSLKRNSSLKLFRSDVHKLLPWPWSNQYTKNVPSSSPHWIIWLHLQNWIVKVQGEKEIAVIYFPKYPQWRDGAAAPGRDSQC